MHKLEGLARVHFKLRRGTQTQALNYCKKGDQSKAEWRKHGVNGENFGKNVKFHEYGVENLTVTKQGARTDLNEVYELVKQNKTDIQIIEEVGFAPYVRCYKAIDKVRLSVMPEWDRKREIILIHGDSGIGKSRMAFDEFGEFYEMPIQANFNSSLWFDGYIGQPTLVLDDFTGEMYLSQLLRLLDVYLRKVQVKGSFVWMTAKRMVITTNIHPSKWYTWSDRENQEEALKRRFVEYGHIRAWSTNKKLEEVDPDDFWPIAPRKDKMKEYLPKGVKRTVAEALMPLPPRQVNLKELAKNILVISNDSLEGEISWDEDDVDKGSLFVPNPYACWVSAMPNQKSLF